MLTTTPSTSTQAEIVREIRELHEQVRAMRTHLATVTFEDRQDAKHELALAQRQIARLEWQLRRPGFERR